MVVVRCSGGDDLLDRPWFYFCGGRFESAACVWKDDVSSAPPVLSIEDLRVVFHTASGPVAANDDINLVIGKYEKAALVGETGCGKSVLGHAILRLLDNIAEISGKIFWKGMEITALRENKMDDIRGQLISLIPQNPAGSFDPVVTIGKQIEEFITVHRGIRGSALKMKALEALSRFDFSNPREIYHAFPHTLSGGMNERALIALGTSLEPELIIADEPTKGLDYFSQANALEVLHDASEGSSLLMITHDLYAASTCDILGVMYGGQIVEYGKAGEILDAPKHPYTRGLLDSHPARGFIPIPGRYVVQTNECGSCRFINRCLKADDKCLRSPRLEQKEVTSSRQVRCHYA
jgi:peptide/nickel transport system ATP-binding protein